MMRAMVRHHVRSFGTNKIMAVKLVRELAHCGLAEALQLVETSAGFFIQANAEAQARAAADARRYGIEFDPPIDGTTGVGVSEPAPERLAGSCSVRYVSGPQIIHSIKLVREITGLGLKEAKDVVDKASEIRTGISRAEDIARRFAEVGARVEIHEAGSLPPPRVSRHDYQNEDDYDF